MGGSLGEVDGRLEREKQCGGAVVLFYHSDGSRSICLIGREAEVFNSIFGRARLFSWQPNAG